MDDTLQVPQGTFRLTRVPDPGRQPLRAWDAADHYLLTHLAQQDATPASVLIVNDGFGALTTALADGRQVQMQSDSWLAHVGTRANLETNGRGPGVELLGILDAPTMPVDAVLFKVPGSLALLEDQLHRLRPLLTPDTLIVGAGMTKQIHSSTLDLCESLLGPTRTSLAQRKARLIFCTFDATMVVVASPYPTRYELEGTGLSLCNHASLFAREQLDIGTRLLLEHLPRAPAVRRIVDLGCGNGVLGIAAARHHRQAALVFCDESAMAIASARANVEAAFDGDRDAQFHWTDCLDGVEPGSADLILCNPPFHQTRSMDDSVAWRMFHAARRVLSPGGSLWIVGNRHLGYHTKLRRLFGNGDVVASNPKFVVLRATKA